MGVGSVLGQMMRAQRGALFGWVPVFLAVGIGGFFSLTWEPSGGFIWSVLAGGVAIAAFARLLPETLRPLAVAMMLIAIGFVLAAARSHYVAGPVLKFSYYGAVEGRIVAMDRSQSDALRLTLDQVVLDRVRPQQTPLRVRLSLHGDRSADIIAEPGLRVMITGHLSAPSGPVEPGGFDFQRHAWFVRLGAVGYARTPLMGVDAPKAGLGVFRLRMAASDKIQSVLAGDIGGFAAAITTGDRSAISKSALEDLRASNLAHLLAISGLHMGLMSGVVFGALRILFALIPALVLRIPARSLAAAGALVVAAGYLALSGGNVATQRAFIMVAVALCALMIGRRAISLRGVAIAATIVLALRPEALMGPGFQMSFAATTALVAVFGWMRDKQIALGPRWFQPVSAVFISSAVAGIATAPIAAAHFNAIAQYGLLANLSCVPLMGVLVIPAAVLAAVLAPFGLEVIGLWAMGLGVRWILFVADFVANLPQSRVYVVAPDGWVIPLLALGFLTLILWRGVLRWSGIIAMAASFVVWGGTNRPDILVSDTGALVGVRTDQGRALSKERGAGFVARNWLENDGDGAGQYIAATKWDKAGQVVHLSGKRAVAAFDTCTKGQLVVSSVPIERLGLPCMVYDPDRLKTTGALAISMERDGPKIVQTAREVSGDRLWTHWPDPRPLRARQRHAQKISH
ncbi:ComEC/Rec2 family competence protein [Sulfitobacter donghicola]|uniref:Competence protein n=1 Tax=Sulfitobacter donghicola DSW-25 = KCTC 12864 = JCM 14565 TaxID=1300350 RepID=A0A073IJ13_9RHOB|nr:ComEC/Rec2 family competence protein [Sulfitobacter donghicola]KEJ89496.1 competence protein [Sulfitobacter donghicola DSW-25 = KCTC 12864 = JCM 14565]KIN69319.1 Competence protein [Sulfitobacter donghicola DSW-25 = KCTC 12864 = JCM 14565]